MTPKELLEDIFDFSKEVNLRKAGSADNDFAIKCIQALCHIHMNPADKERKGSFKRYLEYLSITEPTQALAARAAACLERYAAFFNEPTTTLTDSNGQFTIDVNNRVLAALKRCKFSERDYEAAPVEILSFPTGEIDDPFAKIWFERIGIIMETDSRYFLTALGLIIYDTFQNKNQ